MVTLVGCIRGGTEMGAEVLGCLHPRKDIKTCLHACEHKIIKEVDW